MKILVEEDNFTLNVPFSNAKVDVLLRIETFLANTVHKLTLVNQDGDTLTDGTNTLIVSQTRATETEVIHV